MEPRVASWGTEQSLKLAIGASEVPTILGIAGLFVDVPDPPGPNDTTFSVSIRTRLLPAGRRSLRAFYPGDQVLGPSTSAVLSHTVATEPSAAFTAAVDYGAGTVPASVAVADFNADRRADMVVANAGGDNVSVLLGAENGTFLAAANFGAGAFPTSVAVGDFNNDRRTDWVTANSNGGNVAVGLGAGDGTFEPQVFFQAGTNPVAVVVGDFNGDGDADLAVANVGGDNVSVLLGAGDGTFPTTGAFGTGMGPRSIVAADFNGDNRADLAAANSGSNDVSVLLGVGDGTFQPAAAYAAGSTPNSVVTDDFDGDGKPDLAVANLGSNDVSVLLGAGDGTFRTAVSYAAGVSPAFAAASDFNGDGKTDLAVANLSPSDNVIVLLGTGSGLFQPPVAATAGIGPQHLAVAEFNGDGKADVAVVNNGVSVLFGSGLPTNVTLSASPNSSLLGAPVVLSATAEPSQESPRSFFTFYDGATILGTRPASLGASSITTSMLPSGRRSLRAYYSGDAKYGAGTSQKLEQVVTVQPGTRFQAGASHDLGVTPGSLTLGDFDGDGNTDVAARASDGLKILLGLGGAVSRRRESVMLYER